MGARKFSDGEKVAGVAAAVVAAGFIAWLVTGKDPVEEQIDKVVGALNQTQYRKGWGAFGVAVLKRALGGTLTGELIALVDVVHAVEHLGAQHGWSGLRKQQQAVAYAKSSFATA